MVRILWLGGHAVRVVTACIFLLAGSLMVSVPRSVQDIQDRVAAQARRDHPSAPSEMQATAPTDSDAVLEAAGSRGASATDGAAAEATREPALGTALQPSDGALTGAH